MKVEQDFTSNLKFTLVFDSGKRIELDEGESKEFDEWFNRKMAREEIRE